MSHKANLGLHDASPTFAYIILTASPLLVVMFSKLPCFLLKIRKLSFLYNITEYGSQRDMYIYAYIYISGRSTHIELSYVDVEKQ